MDSLYWSFSLRHWIWRSYWRNLHFLLGIKKLEEAKQGNSYTENNFTANIDHYHADNGGSDNTDNNEPWKTTANPNGTQRDYVSKDTLEENR